MRTEQIVLTGNFLYAALEARPFGPRDEAAFLVEVDAPRGYRPVEAPVLDRPLEHIVVVFGRDRDRVGRSTRRRFWRFQKRTSAARPAWRSLPPSRWSSPAWWPSPPIQVRKPRRAASTGVAPGAAASTFSTAWISPSWSKSETISHSYWSKAWRAAVALPLERVWLTFGERKAGRLGPTSSRMEPKV